VTETDHYYNFLKDHNFTVTLGEIMQTRFACEYRKHNTLLRGKGFDVKCERNSQDPSRNVYRVTPKVEPVEYKYEGQQGILLEAKKS